MDKKKSFGKKIALLGTTISVAAYTFTMYLTDKTRDNVNNIVTMMGEAHGDDRDMRAKTPGISPEEINSRIQIQTKLTLMSELIKDNQRFHGFWSLGWNKIPNFSDTDERLEEIHRKLQDTKTTPGELEKLDQKLAEILREFMVIMRGDEEALTQELREGMAYMSEDDINLIQEYMRECLDIISTELSMGNTEADYLRTSDTDVDVLIHSFIGEEDITQSRKDIIKIVEHFKKLSGNDSSLAFHHLAGIAERLRKGDNPDEVSAKYFGVLSGAGLGLLALITGIYVLVRLTALINWWHAGARRARDLQRILQKGEQWFHQVFGASATASIVGWNISKPFREIIGNLLKEIGSKIGKLMQKKWSQLTGSPPPLDLDEIVTNTESNRDTNTSQPTTPLGDD